MESDWEVQTELKLFKYEDEYNIFHLKKKKNVKAHFRMTGD